MVLPLVSGVSAGEGVVASGLGVGGGAGVGVVVPGPGVGRGRSGVTGCGRSPLLAAGLVGPPLRPSGFWRPCSPPGGLLGSCCLGLCVLRVWCGRRLRFGVWCALVGLVSVAVVGVCVVCTLGRVCGVLVVRWGACPRLCGRGLAALFGGPVCRAPPPCLGCVVPRPPWLGSVGGASPCCAFCVPSSFCLFSVSLGAVSCPGLPGCGVWGGGPCRRLGSLPLVFPRGGAGACTPRQDVTLLYGCRPWTCSVARYSSRSPHRGRVHCGSLGSPRGTGASLACPDGRCALPAAPRWARTAVRAVGSALGQAHWSSPQAGATAGR